MTTARGLGLALGPLLLLGVVSADAQQRFPGAPEPEGGRPTSPFYEGWYANPDGTYTLSFGYFNRNADEVIEIPVGPDNFIEPARFDGSQPTVFDPQRHVGVLEVTVPGDFAEDGGRVVWTLRNRGVTHSVPGRIGSSAYQLHYGPMAMGSLPPLLRLREGGPELWGPMSKGGDPREPSTWVPSDAEGSVENPLSLTASVGTPLELNAWVEDRLEPGAERESVRGGVTWYTHRGPTSAIFSEVEPEVDEADGVSVTRVTFSQPGEYLLRVRANNFNPVDSTPGDQCCWTNGYLAVTVAP